MRCTKCLIRKIRSKRLSRGYDLGGFGDFGDLSVSRSAWVIACLLKNDPASFHFLQV